MDKKLKGKEITRVCRLSFPDQNERHWSIQMVQRKMPYGMAEITRALKVHLGKNKRKRKLEESSRKSEKPKESGQEAS